MRTNLFLTVAFLFLTLQLYAKTTKKFIHPGGLHTLDDLNRMKEKVNAGESPWIDGWNKMLKDPKASKDYRSGARANMGASRQRAAKDAQAAYLNALRWYISGDKEHAETAVAIMNSWSKEVDRIPSGSDQPGLSGIYTFDFAIAAEVLRMYDGWSSKDINRFKKMMRTYLYPIVHDFLENHSGTCITYFWANWDICNIGALISMGVFLDDEEIYNEGIEYYKNGKGNGNINRAIFHRYMGPEYEGYGLGQWQESGRDQPHGGLGVGMMAEFCQIAWNQGDDLFGYNNNLLLAGAEYIARTNLSQPVPYLTYNNCDNVNQFWLSRNGIGRIFRPVWEILYNHYVVRQGLNAPNLEHIANLARPEGGSGDHLGFGTLAFTLDAEASSMKPYPTPDSPQGVIVTSGVSRVDLKWAIPSETTMQGYTIERATRKDGPFKTVAQWSDNTTPAYTDFKVKNGTTYFYRVAANNKSGTSEFSTAISATPVEATSDLPEGWKTASIGDVTVEAETSYAPVSNNTFIVRGAGRNIGGSNDAVGFTYNAVNGDATISARMIDAKKLKKAGVMIRESLDADAKTLMITRGDVGWRIAVYGMRYETGSEMEWIDGNKYSAIDPWLMLKRNGDTFTAYQSIDGINWHMVGSVFMSMSQDYYIGLVACSGNNDQLSTITFDNVSLIK